MYRNLCLMLSLFAFAQVVRGQQERGQFFYRLQASANFCQIDGDEASGFNKFGYTIGTWIGQQLGHGWTYETGFAFSNRGSRRAFNPDNPGALAIHYNFSMIDIPVFLVKKYRDEWSFGPGLRTTWLLNASDRENNYLNLRDDMRSSGLLGCLMATWHPNPKSAIRLEYQYSLASIRKPVQQNPFNPLLPTGVYHNVISLGMVYSFSN